MKNAIEPSRPGALAYLGPATGALLPGPVSGEVSEAAQFLDRNRMPASIWSASIGSPRLERKR